MSPRRAPAHSRQSATKASRPISCRVFPVRSLRSRSTTICVAMPAWSTPGTQSTARPCILRQRQSTSSSVRPRACPTCRRPVTFGGGITSVYGTASGPAASGRKNPASSWARYQRISNEAGSKFLPSSGRVFIGERAGSHEGAGLGKGGPLLGLVQLVEALFHEALGELGHDVPRDLAHDALAGELEDPPRDAVDVVIGEGPDRWRGGGRCRGLRDEALEIGQARFGGEGLELARSGLGERRGNRGFHGGRVPEVRPGGAAPGRFEGGDV